MVYLEWYVVWFHDKVSWCYKLSQCDDSENVIEVWRISQDMIMRDGGGMSKINRKLISVICLIRKRWEMMNVIMITRYGEMDQSSVDMVKSWMMEMLVSISSWVMIVKRWDYMWLRISIRWVHISWWKDMKE